jgi:hypothetical protein
MGGVTDEVVGDLLIGQNFWARTISSQPVPNARQMDGLEDVFANLESVSN